MTYLSETFARKHLASIEDTMVLELVLPAYLQRYIEVADVMLVVLGRNWMGMSSSGSRALTQPGDVLREGLLAGAERLRAGQLAIVPILLHGLRMQDLDLPPELAFFRHLQPGEVSEDRIAAHVKALAERIKLRAWGPSADWPSPPLILDQGITIDQLAPALAASTPRVHALRAEDRICLQRNVYGTWHYEIMNPSGKDLDSYYEQEWVDHLQGMKAQEAVGHLMIWYTAPMEKVFCRIDPPLPPSRLKRLFYRASGQWGPWTRLDTAFYGLPPLLQAFVGRAKVDRNRHVIPPQPGAAIDADTSTVGYFGPGDVRTFGTYVLTLTYATDGIADGTDEVVYFPRVLDTDLRFVDIYRAPQFSQVKWTAHVGLGEYGFHLVYSNLE